MECPACKTELPIEAKFCNVCGEKLEIDCPQCSKSNPPGSRFCLACGKQLASKPLGGKSEAVVPDAERKQVTALFSDLSGYTAMNEKLDPEEVKEITGRIFDGVRTIVSKYDGFIERFAGDGVLALFGIPKSHDDDAVRAVRAAREIHELVERMNPTYGAKVGANLSMHSGINTGLTVTADVDPNKGTHGVTGDAINVAARLSDLAKSGDILAGPLTYRQAEGHFTFQPFEPVTFKGKSEPISVYKVLALKEQPITVHRQSGLRAELIGRKAELVQLREAVERLKTGKASVIALCGDAGTGKSRLVEEFKASLDLGKVRWREGHAYPYSQNISYFPLIDLMSRAWKIEEGYPPSTVREKIESGVERLLGSKKQVAPYVGSLYSLSYPEIEDVSPEFWRSRLFEGVHAIVAALTRYGPTIFCFEDIHWSDPSTLDLLRHLITELRNPALFLCVYRPPFSLFTSHQLKSLGKSYEEIRLQDLSQSDTHEMLKSLLKTESIPIELRRFVLDKIEGNPFYLEEMINSLLESGTLARENGHWMLTRPLVESDVPATVQGVISARLDRLEKEVKRILQEASVIGRAFQHEILKRITALQESLDESLRTLEMLDLVRVRSLQPDLEYIFKHALTQEVVYSGLLKKERQEIHERIGLMMEQLFQDRLTEFYETLAFHFKQGRSVAKAVTYLMKAGEKSLKRFALEESLHDYHEAYNLLSDKGVRTKEEEVLLIDLLIEWGMVFYYVGDFKTYIGLLRAHEDIAVALEDKARLGMFYAWLGWSHCYRADLKTGYQILMKALALGEEIENEQVIGYACTWLAWNCAELGFLNDAIAFGQRAQEVSKFVASDQYLYTKSSTGMGSAYQLRGDWKKTLEMGKDVLAHGESHSNIRGMVMGHIGIGQANFACGDFFSCTEACQTAINLTTDPLYVHWAKVVQSAGYLFGGELEKAQAAAQDVVKFSRDFGTEWFGTHAELIPGVVLVASGNLSEGLDRLEDLKQTFLEKDWRCLYAMSEHIMGSIYLKIALGEGDFRLSTVVKNIGFLAKTLPLAAKKAEHHFNSAIETAKEIGAKGTLGVAYFDLGRLHIAKRRIEQARDCMTKAIDAFEQCALEARVKQAKEVLASLG